MASYFAHPHSHSHSPSQPQPHAQSPSPRPSDDMRAPFADFDQPYYPHDYHFGSPALPDEAHSAWPALPLHAAHQLPRSSASFLSDLYDSRLKLDEPLDAFAPDSLSSSWASLAHAAPAHAHAQFADQPFYRRASFPYSSLEQADYLPTGPNFLVSDLPLSSFSSRVYDEPLPLAADPSSLESAPRFEDHFDDASQSDSAPDPFEMDPVKSEYSSPLIVPSQAPYCRPSSSSSTSSAPAHMNAPNMNAATVTHTDDASSKETQFLRRKCFNCQTTEPPSWRRSTLNPGKIVCNKCGLYERTHLRPRPHRFDELRATSKVKKPVSKLLLSSPSPKFKTRLIKKERKLHESLHSRRSSIASNSSSTSHSDWEDGSNVGSVLSTFSAPTSAFNSPSSLDFKFPATSSPSNTIRIPESPFMKTPVRKSVTAPLSSSVFDTTSSSLEYFARRHSVATGMPEVTGWHTVPLSELGASSPARARKASRKLAV
ncbi:hypothetical protein BOTBODRAFT_26540 [Botryobasidium botryosum FD-172 SS1]|uniref:GATA-type domain-containing protein n=1 Tax=Botryobasidium botryosum (strain FD-172 SS1) TaxID=930990 RepID=A0A067N9Q6_BOTB1|nr:hypothetical protein BOTBODRAFT_26540 [Botryobasidium botryosum FD-172 SS1]